MNLNELKHIFFIGIGGIGMSALARYFNQQKIRVTGYDKTETELINELLKEGIEICFKDEVSLIPDNIDLVVYTPAIPVDHRQFNHLKAIPIPMLKRSELLGEISQGKFTIAIAGTHGKTTISSIIPHIFKTAGIKISGFVGGISKNYQSNFIGDADAKVMIVEADEYDRSFLSLLPDISLISSMDADHLDIYGTKNHLKESFSLFAKQLKPNGTLIVNQKIGDEFIGIDHLTYGLNENSDFEVNLSEIKNHAFHFEIDAGEDFIFRIPGRHNLENAVAAIAVAKAYGIKDEFIKEALHSYQGVKRRFDIIVATDDRTYIDDYAHHPEELKACINAVKEFYPGQKITGIFQPHLFTRTRDFADEFARSLELLDELILLDIYPAREQELEGITSSFLLEKINLEKKQLLSNEEVLGFVAKQKPSLLLTLGAGDIDKLVKPIKERIDH